MVSQTANTTMIHYKLMVIWCMQFGVSDQYDTLHCCAPPYDGVIVDNSDEEMHIGNYTCTVAKYKKVCIPESCVAKVSLNVAAYW